MVPLPQYRRPPLACDGAGQHGALAHRHRLDADFLVVGKREQVHVCWREGEYDMSERGASCRETSRPCFYLHLLLLLQLLTTTHRDKSHCEDSCLAHIFLLMKPANNNYEIQVSQLASRGAVKRKMFFSVTDAARRRNYCNLQKKGKELSLMFCKYSGWFMRRYNYESRISSLTASASISMWPSGTKQTLLGGTGLLTLKIFSERLDCFRHAQCLNKTRMYIHSFWRR